MMKKRSARPKKHRKISFENRIFSTWMCVSSPPPHPPSRPNAPTRSMLTLSTTTALVAPRRGVRRARGDPRLAAVASFHLFGGSDGKSDTTPKQSRWNMKPVDHTATTVPSPSPRAPPRSTRAPSADGPLLSRYADHASWFEGDERVTVYAWSDAARRLDLINRALAVVVDESAGECAVNFDGDACFSAVGRAMMILSNATHAEAVAVTEKILRVGGPVAGDAVVSWCRSHPDATHANSLAPFAAAFDHAASPATRHYSNNAVASYLRDVAEECPVFHGADEACAATVDAALTMTSWTDRAEAEVAAAAVLEAGGGAAAAAAIAWCAQNPGATHVDVIEALARAKAREADAEREAREALGA